MDCSEEVTVVRHAVEPLLDVTNGSVTLSTLGKAAAALGCRLRVELV